MNPETLHQALLDPRTYPVPPQRIDFRETHISRLYLTEDVVYKVKKPVDFGFLDFTTLDLRRHFCAEEVRLNRRFAPDTYLGVSAICNSRGRIRIDGDGDVVEYAVRMRLLPQERMLDHLLERNAPELAGALPLLGRTIGRLHAGSDICRSEAETHAQSIHHNWQENLRQMEPLLGTTLSGAGLALCRDRISSALVRLAPLLTEREAAGLVRDGHGDLHAEHICLTEPIRIYDCIEFNRRFRIVDILGDIAFLLMDLDFRGRRDLATLVHRTWQETVGVADDPELLRFYRIYRAFVRGKVETLLAADPGAAPATRAAATLIARRYFNLALGYLAPPALYLTCGLMGVGKTSVAQPLAHALGATLLRSDVVRKELPGISRETGASAPFCAGLYTPEQTRRTYDRLLQLATAELAAKRPVVVDASFARPEERARFREAAQQSGCPSLLVYLSCDEQTALHRLAQRFAAGTDASDGRPELYRQQAAHFVPPFPAEESIELDTRDAADVNVQNILIRLLHRART